MKPHHLHCSGERKIKSQTLLVQLFLFGNALVPPLLSSPSPHLDSQGGHRRPRLHLPLFFEASFSASLGVLKSTGSLAGLWPWMLMDWTCTMYSVSSSRSQRAQERVVVFSSWMKRIMRTSFFCKPKAGKPVSSGGGLCLGHGRPHAAYALSILPGSDRGKQGPRVRDRAKQNDLKGIFQPGTKSNVRPRHHL